MVNRHKYIQYGAPGLQVEGICVHNVAQSAAEELNVLDTSNTLNIATHFLVDDAGVLEVMPTDWKVRQTIKGNDYPYDHCIGVTICNSQMDKETYLKGQEIAVELVKKLLDEYGLDISRLYFHCEFNERNYCPEAILRLYGNKSNFIKEEF